MHKIWKINSKGLTGAPIIDVLSILSCTVPFRQPGRTNISCALALVTDIIFLPVPIFSMFFAFKHSWIAFWDQYLVNKGTSWRWAMVRQLSVVALDSLRRTARTRPAGAWLHCGWGSSRSRSAQSSRLWSVQAVDIGLANGAARNYPAFDQCPSIFISIKTSSQTLIRGCQNAQ